MPTATESTHGIDDGSDADSEVRGILATAPLRSPPSVPTIGLHTTPNTTVGAAGKATSITSRSSSDMLLQQLADGARSMRGLPADAHTALPPSTSSSENKAKRPSRTGAPGTGTVTTGIAASKAVPKDGPAHLHEIDGAFMAAAAFSPQVRSLQDRVNALIGTGACVSRLTRVTLVGHRWCSCA
jgi:hypothetical protein